MNTIVGIVADHAHLDRVIEAVKAEGVSDEDISVVAPIPDPNITNGQPPQSLATYFANVSEVTMPGLGPLMATGTFFAPFFGEMPSESLVVAPGLVPRLVEVGLSEEQARAQDEHLRDGGILIAVTAKSEGRSRDLRRILDLNHVNHVIIGPKID